MTPAPPSRDIVNDALNTARVRLNDAISSIYPTGGKLIENTQAFSQQAVNSGWRRLQAFLANLGYSRLTREAVITGLPIVGSHDPTTLAWINWFNYSDGVNLFATPILPPDLIVPQRLYERVSTQNAYFVPMELMIDGIPSFPKQAVNRWWEWRDDTIFFPGALLSMDLKIRYSAFLPDFVDVGYVRWYEQWIPMMRCLDAFASFICLEIAEGRDDLDAQRFADKAESAAKQIINRDVSMKQRTNIRRIPRSGRSHGGWGWGW